MSDDVPTVDAAEVADATASAKRVLIAGTSGTGKSTLLGELADVWCDRGEEILALSADPGRPLFGPPGAVNLAGRNDSGWDLRRTEGLGSLDAIRFRLPLATAVSRLMRSVGDERLLVDVPGVSRGPTSAELLRSLADICDVEAAVVLMEKEREPDFLDTLRTSVPTLLVYRPSGDARSPTSTQRAVARTEAWENFLADAEEVTLSAELLLDDVFDHNDAGSWPGRQIVLIGSTGETLGLGEVVDQAGVEFHLKARRIQDGDVTALLARDAGRNDKNRLRTRTGVDDPVEERRVRESGPFTLREKPEIPIAVGNPPELRGASVKASMIGGLFGDPMVVLRLDYRRRCLLFDMGELRNIPTRIVHEAADIFVTHCHMDHVNDFPWLFRKRLGYRESCRLYGPPGFHDRFASMADSFTWDRLDSRAPRFEVAEIDGDQIRWANLTLGEPMKPGRTAAIEDHVILDDPRFLVRAYEVDHGIPVLAFSLEESHRYDVRPERLREHGWTPGAWLGELKTRAARREFDAEVELPGGDAFRVDRLMEEILIERPGQKIAYATDFANSEANRETVSNLATGAHIFFCEAAFAEADRDQAQRTGHLTAKDCGELAAAADVGKLIPFHFSSRYVTCPEQIYQEILAVFDRVVIPASLWERMGRRERE